VAPPHAGAPPASKAHRRKTVRGAKRYGDPVLTWEMFPKGISYLDENRMYLKVHQKLDIEINWWPDYEASITYHLFLHLDGAKHLKGYVARWAYWIEGGAKADNIEEKLKPAVISGMNTFNTELSKQLNALSPFTFSDLYYLPGNQTGPVPTGRQERLDHGRRDDRVAALSRHSILGKGVTHVER
jgi:hypothetical protein